MLKNTEAERRFYTLMSGLGILVIHVLFIYLILHYNYNSLFRTQLYFRGHMLVSGVYMAAFVYLGGVFGGLLVGMRKKGEVLFTEVFTAAFADGIFYLMVMMYSFSFPTLVPLLLALLSQILCSFLWIWGCDWLYRRLFKPYEVLLVYSGGSVESFERKLKQRSDQLRISRRICASESMEDIFRAVDEVHTVILWDIPVAERNIIFKYCYENSKRIFVSPKIPDIIFNGAASVHMLDTPLLRTDGNPLEYEERIIKRFFDLILALLLIVIASPVMLITAVAIKVSDGGPVLYSQVRCTKGMRKFYIYKFRSMIVDAEKKSGARLAMEKDDRITPVGRFIRKVRIDELPQLFNVLKGDMSFVGPRPERPEFIEKYMQDMPEFSYRTKVLAGITGYAQLYGKYNTSPYDKLKLDLYYIEQYSLLLDLKLIILTAKILFTMESTEGTSEVVTAEADGKEKH